MKYYFIGIGGIGISAVAQYFKAQGHDVYGSDLVESEITELLKEKGISVFLNQNKENIDQVKPDIVAFSPAVNPDNPEYIQAQELGIVCKTSPELLGEITKEYFTIAVCGSHGKSTTAAMAALMLENSDLDPTVIIGTKLKEFGNTNFRAGKSKYLIIEADEYKRSFLNHWPQIVILTNIEIDHLDYFKDLADLKSAYHDFISHLPEDGYLILNQSIENDFGVKNCINYSNQIKLDLKVPGDYNQENANAVLKLAEILDISKELAIKSLENYQGAWRRLEEKEMNIEGKIIIHISDYGHHPTQLIETVKGIRQKYPDKFLTCVFQPHQYKRTLFFHEEFKKNLSLCKELSNEFILTDIYDVAGREDQIAKSQINSRILAEEAGVKYVPQAEIREYLKDNLQDGQVLLIMSAGDFYTL